MRTSVTLADPDLRSIHQPCWYRPVFPVTWQPEAGVQAQGLPGCEQVQDQAWLLSET